MMPNKDMTTGARFSPKKRSIVDASRSAPPETSSILPSTAPNPMIRTRNPKVSPTPASRSSPMSASSTPVANATAMAAMAKARDPCILHRTISNTTSAIAAIRISTSAVVDNTAQTSRERRCGRRDDDMQLLSHLLITFYHFGRVRHATVAVPDDPALTSRCVVEQTISPDSGNPRRIDRAMSPRVQVRRHPPIAACRCPRVARPRGSPR